LEGYYPGIEVSGKSGEGQGNVRGTSGEGKTIEKCLETGIREQELERSPIIIVELSDSLMFLPSLLGSARFIDGIT
jgi:hypothetical protein